MEKHDITLPICHQTLTFLSVRLCPTLNPDRLVQPCEHILPKTTRINPHNRRWVSWVKTQDGVIYLDELVDRYIYRTLPPLPRDSLLFLSLQTYLHTHVGRTTGDKERYWLVLVSPLYPRHLLRGGDIISRHSPSPPPHLQIVGCEV